MTTSTNRDPEAALTAPGSQKKKQVATSNSTASVTATIGATPVKTISGTHATGISRRSWGRRAAWYELRRNGLPALVAGWSA